MKSIIIAGKIYELGEKLPTSFKAESDKQKAFVKKNDEALAAKAEKTATKASGAQAK